MEENKVNNDKFEKINEVIKKIENKESKFLFFVPDVGQPNASVTEIYTHAKTVKDMGYSTYILTETKEYEKPFWVDSELLDHEYMEMENARLKLGPEDVLVIPEVFTNVMEQTKNLPCVRTVFVQSLDYMLNSLIVGSDWSSFGIKDVITTSNTLKDFIEDSVKNKFNIHTYSIGIPEYFVNDKDYKKDLKISLVGRNQNEVMKVIKLFYLNFPQYNFITFETMTTESVPPQPLTRKDFADKLKKNFAALWLDRISSFGTFPLECMKAGTIPIGVVPDLAPEYIFKEDGKTVDENSGFWTDSTNQVHKLIYNAISQFIDDSIDDKYYKNMKEIADKYSVEKSTKEISEIYTNILEERLNNLKNTVKQ